jgi:hypothetical protein
MNSPSPRRKKSRLSTSAAALPHAKKVAVDFPAPLFVETERAARELSTSCSFLVRSAVERFLAELRRQKLEKELATGYMANDLRAASSLKNSPS